MLAREAWKVASRQHHVVSRVQLLEIGYSSDAIRWRIAKGRLHPISRGVYAVGHPDPTQEGRWMAAVLACGPGAYLSHNAAAQLMGMRARPRPHHRPPIDISLNAAVFRAPPGIRVHRTCTLTPDDTTSVNGIPCTSPIRTLIDLATFLPAPQLERAVGEADVFDLVDPETLRRHLEARKGLPGTRRLRALLDRHTFRLTETELEQRFLAIVRRAGLPLPDTQVRLGGRVDFHWPTLGLVVETDGWRYHRTAARQAEDNRRMQAHAAAGRTAIRVSHREIRFEAARVEGLLEDLVLRHQAA